VGEKLAPGTALIRAVILSVEEIENEIGEITVRVDEIMGYGASTPPISSGTKFSFDVLHYLQGDPIIRDQIRVNGEIKILISYQEGIQLNDSDKKKDWELVEFKSE
jgi:hypothetical protein